MIPLGIHSLYSLVTFLITSSNAEKNTVQITLHVLPGDFTTCIFIFYFFPNPLQLDIWKVRNQLRPRPKWKAGKSRYITLKSASFAFDTAHYKGKGKSHCIPDPWKKRKKEKQKKSFEMGCWVESSLAQVVALMAQPLGTWILGLDKTGAGPISVGTGLVLWELLSHAVWRRTDGFGSTYGHATGFISVETAPDVIAPQPPTQRHLQHRQGLLKITWLHTNSSHESALKFPFACPPSPSQT